MPFCSKEIATNPNSHNAELGKLCREYYQGMHIALDSLNKVGDKIIFHVYDTQNDSLVTLKIIQKPEFKASNLIIGPVLQGGNKMLTPLCNDKKIYHVSPLMTFSKTRLNDKYWISTHPNLTSFAGILYNYIQAHFDTVQILVVSDRSSFDKHVGEGFKSLSPSSKKIIIKTVSYTPTLDVNPFLSATRHNILVIPTHNEQVANNILYQMKDTSMYRNLTCFGFQQWLDFKNADIELWQSRNVIFATTFYIDYANPATRKFIETYREKYGTEPSEAAYKGYDQGLLFIGKRVKKGKDFMEKIADSTFHSIHTPYQFVKQKSGAYHNNILNFIHFQNDELKRVED